MRHLLPSFLANLDAVTSSTIPMWSYWRLDINRDSGIPGSKTFIPGSWNDPKVTLKRAWHHGTKMGTTQIGIGKTYDQRETYGKTPRYPGSAEHSEMFKVALPMGALAGGGKTWKKRSNVWQFDELNIGFPLVFMGFPWVFHGFPWFSFTCCVSFFDSSSDSCWHSTSRIRRLPE